MCASFVIPRGRFRGPLFPSGSVTSKKVSCSSMVLTGSKYLGEKKSQEAPQISTDLHRNRSPIAACKKIPLLLHCRAEETPPKVRFVLLPTSVAWKQLGVPEIVFGRVSGVCEGCFPVSAAVCGCGGNCVSVHLQVHQLVAWARSVHGVTAAAVGANQSEDQREEAHTYWGGYSI